MEQRARIDHLDPPEIRAFILAGRARFTVVSPATGKRFTFKVSMPRRPRPGCPHFVSVLTGSDNDADYTYLGCIFEDGRFTVTRKSSFTPQSPCAVAFAWLWGRLTNDQWPHPAELWHEGRCCRCGRTLTVPESIARGIGPECLGKMGLAA